MYYVHIIRKGQFSRGRNIFQKAGIFKEGGVQTPLCTMGPPHGCVHKKFPKFDPILLLVRTD